MSNTPSAKALDSLFHRKPGDSRPWPHTWPDATPLVWLRCPRGCRMGGVYTTHEGRCLLRRRGRGGNWDISMLWAADVSDKRLPWHCKHGKPVEWVTFDLDELAALADDVAAKRRKQPAKYMLKHP